LLRTANDATFEAIMGKARSERVSIPPLLSRIARHGWTEELGRRFEAEYGDRLRWQIVASMERLGMLQFRISPERTDVLSDRRSALFDNTLSDLWIELMGGMVDRYVQGVREGRIAREIVAYLRGVIRHLVIRNARDLRLIGSETPQESISAFCQAKQESTRRGRLAWLKFALEGRVRQEMLSRCGPEVFQSVYRGVHRVADYFFEEFIPSRCEDVARLGSRVLDVLVGDLLLDSTCLEAAVEYIGTVTPFSAGETATGRVPEAADEDEYLSCLARAAGSGWR